MIQIEFNKHFAKQLKKAMNRTGISSRELARRLNISPSTVSRWLTDGQYTILAVHLFNLCDIFQVDPMWFTKDAD